MDAADISLDRRVDLLEAEIAVLKQAIRRLQRKTVKKTEAA
jgi:hypothetical protein